ncbi:hypothetical protein [Methanorbis furvi]|uniref:DUF2178 domain-containing protein n=1 Tax=Methanorbis furvi TaxID=3028299 RepID=A0AAE4MC33_9EURY|nr:hypothetical protein [Methanocorpusculaceae archaeon Ag1]
MKITKRLFSLCLIFAFFLVCGILGLLLEYLYPNVPPGPGLSGVTYGIIGVVVGGCFILGCLYRYRRDPAEMKIDDKPYQDERWLRVQEKGASSTFYVVLGLLFLCVTYVQYICEIFLGISDMVIVENISRMFLSLMLLSVGALVVFVIHYYYAKV